MILAYLLVKLLYELGALQCKACRDLDKQINLYCFSFDLRFDVEFVNLSL